MSLQWYQSPPLSRWHSSFRSVPVRPNIHDKCSSIEWPLLDVLRIGPFRRVNFLEVMVVVVVVVVVVVMVVVVVFWGKETEQERQK